MTTPITSTPNIKPHGLLASERLEPGAIYTREDLRVLFDIKDATLNTGIFRPKGYDSVWLFITEHKTSDRTQYVDALLGDTLHMQGQRMGRTDALISDHRQRGLELLLFYRKAKYEYPHAGFKYEGIFTYQRHSGSTPTSFVLSRNQTTADEALSAKIEQQFSNQGEFNPGDLSDARTRTVASIVRRRGQPQFRKQLLKAYQGRCAITACSLQQVLEAAHIHPYLGDETNIVSNGLLLRADVHTLFDLGLLWVNPNDLRIEISEVLRSSEYVSIEGRSLYLPENEAEHPSRRALEFRFNTIANR
ncbi:HNH endonuclease [Pseudomonas asiatica]|uniref:HNH endonuclease n=1 Tax=Pseudomonas asiatica TaxID=2219225 RepID=A0ABU5L4N9_9PSED|nr:HNH endonuclease [Pseudomonas asiatica]MDZ5741126.1 HNH endonuclease [Pseudomonas asiatica]MDZ5744724.1 HNH endonuclease [Pseudomonas asiatica]MDZ5751378.1 HNH endonuclease [Pseudomonas asiatica]MDZ5756550.1 HNH endonuclease [Pseudomonas asiatica]